MALTDNLSAWWTLDEASGSRVDSHTNGLDLTDEYGTASSGTGKVGDALEVAGSADRILRPLASCASLQMGTGDLSFNCWIRPSPVPQTAALVGVQDFEGAGASQPGYRVWFYKAMNRVQWGMAAGGVRYQDATTLPFTLSADTWYMLTTVYDRDGEMKLYVDAVERASKSIAAADGVDVQVGNGLGFTLGNLDTGGLGFEGRIDEAAVFATALSVAEIAELHNSGAGVTYSDISGNIAPLAHHHRQLMTA